MIKFALRRNLIYPFQLLLWGFFRNLEEYLIELHKIIRYVSNS